MHWGNGNLTDITDLRNRYIEALHDADRGDFNALIEFVKGDLENMEKMNQNHQKFF